MHLLTFTGMLLLSGSVYATESGNTNMTPRLKFKSGPVCMCTDGLSEKDILAGKMMQPDTDEIGSTNQLQQLETSQSRDTEDK